MIDVRTCEALDIDFNLLLKVQRVYQFYLRYEKEPCLALDLAELYLNAESQLYNRDG